MLGRVAIESVALFLTPFVLFGVYLALRARYPLETEHWTSGRLSLLTVAGLGLALLFFVTLELLAPRGHGTYIPAHIENGALIPGRFE